MGVRDVSKSGGSKGCNSLDIVLKRAMKGAEATRGDQKEFGIKAHGATETLR